MDFLFFVSAVGGGTALALVPTRVAAPFLCCGRGSKGDSLFLPRADVTMVLAGVTRCPRESDRWYRAQFVGDIRPSLTAVSTRPFQQHDPEVHSPWRMGTFEGPAAEGYGPVSSVERVCSGRRTAR